jgi:hypothetical protein
MIRILKGDIVQRLYMFDSKLHSDNGELFVSKGEVAHVYMGQEYKGCADNIFSLCQGITELKKEYFPAELT